MEQKKWETAEERLKDGKSVMLRIDGYKVELRPVKHNGFSVAVLPFVNGEYNSLWLIRDCEEHRRFFNTINTTADNGREIIDCRAVWTSTELMRIHFEKENRSIELIEEEHYKVPLKKFYFTFGSDRGYPYTDGWVEVYATDMVHAIFLFKREYPNRKGLVNCANYYSEDNFTMKETGNLGAYCHRVILPEGAETDD
mgnify:FL=1